MASPRVDVVIPCYNYAHYLPGCVGSVLAQAGVDVRVLIIDDHSSDPSFDVARELAARDPRIELRRHEVNRGHIATFNEGLVHWSSGDYVALLSADDRLAPGCLQRAATIMDADPAVGMVYGHAPYFDDDARLPATPRTAATGHRVWSGAAWLEALCRGGHNVISSPEVLVRGPLQRAVGGYRPDLPHTGDLEMWLRIAARSSIGYVRGAPQAYYRVHAASMQRTLYGRKIVDLHERKAAFDAFHADHRHRRDDAERLHRSALRALAREALWEACRAYDRNEVELAGADELVDFALASHPAARDEPEYGALLRRRRLGARWCRRTQLFALPALTRRVGAWLRHEHWKRYGL